MELKQALFRHFSAFADVFLFVLVVKNYLIQHLNETWSPLNQIPASPVSFKP